MNKKTKNAFTLIELLAVIVILAIIALIATPIVLDIIDDTKKSSIARSADFYLDGVEQSIMKQNLNGTSYFSPSLCLVESDGNLNCDKGNLEIDVNGKKPTSGYIKFNNGVIENYNLSIENEDITNVEYTPESCFV